MNFRCFGLAVLLVSVVFAAPDPNFHIYLAFGQSNMEGMGAIESQDELVNSRFKVLWAGDEGSCVNRSKGAWYTAVPPLASCWGGLGPVDYFGRTLVKNLPEEITVGVVVVAVSGCDIQLFEKENYQTYNLQPYMDKLVASYGGNPYGRLVEMAKKAQEDGVIKGILMHQGETNLGQTNWLVRVKGVYENLLADLGLSAAEVPLLAGEVVQSDVNGFCGAMNSIIDQLPNTIPTAHVVSSAGLNHQGDSLHFSSAAYRTLGERYAVEMLNLMGVTGIEADAFSAAAKVGNAVIYGNRVEIPVPGQRSRNLTAKLYNVFGKEILDFSDSLRDGLLHFDSAKMPSGEYLIVIQSGMNRSLQTVFLVN